MRQIFCSAVIAFSMYSKIPMPKAEWTKENMKYTMCFFPLVGVVIGAVVYGMWNLMNIFGFSKVFQSAVMTVIPLLVTGGIHFDGYLDTIDALSSYQTKERRLEILKDPHTGAFAVIGAGIYFCMAFGIWHEVETETLQLLVFIYILSRACSGFSIVTFQCAKNSGLAAMFADSAVKKKVRLTMLLYIVLCSAVLLFLDPLLGLTALVVTGVVFLYYYQVSIKNFGGITGDLAGYFLQLCELAAAGIIVAASVVLR